MLSVFTSLAINVNVMFMGHIILDYGMGELVFVSDSGG